MEVVKHRMLLPMRRANETINALGCSTLRHHQFFQASPMKLLPIVGALLLSTAPVQALETYEEGKRKLVSYVCDYSHEGKTAEEVIADFNEHWRIANLSYTATTFD